MFGRALLYPFLLSLLAAGCAGAGSGAATDAGLDAGDETPDATTPPVDAACWSQCSADEREVVDCHGEIVASCSDEQVCSGSVCVDACEVARNDHSSVGCDYHVVAPDVLTLQGGCFAAFVANTWSAPVEITVERGGQSFDVSQFARIPSGSGPAITYEPLPGGMLPVGEVAILFLSQSGFSIGCPNGVVPAVTAEDPAVHGTGLGQSFQIATSAPVVAYDIYPYGGGPSAITSATLLLPTSVWDLDYIAVDAHPRDASSAGLPFIEVVASEDGTTVSIVPTVAIEGGPGVAMAAPGEPATYTLDRGEVLQFTQVAQLIGSPIQADKPIGVWGGSTCLNIPSGVSYCDAAHQQIPPARALGSEYVAARYRDRFDDIPESPPWRLVGAVDGTELSYEPAPPAGAPTTLDKGETVTFNAPGPFVVRSQSEDHPFYMSAHMTGCFHVSTGECRGDPEFVNVIPPAQYLSSYTFFTDPTYPETNLVLVRERGDAGFADVTLPCRGVIDGWQPVDDGGRFQMAHVDLSRGNFEPQGGCDNGRHVMSSELPFGLTVWGWGSSASAFYSEAVSYAYPAGASVETINDVIIN